MTVRRYILTGAPGAGKTSILHGLAGRGYHVVEEAATDVIVAEQARDVAEPWTSAGFVGQILAVQRERQAGPVPSGVTAQIYDRSPVCTLALARHLGEPVPPALAQEIARITHGQIYQRHVFFVRPIGVCEPTAARRISYAESLKFERIHEAAYRACGYEIVDVPAGAIAERVAMIDECITRWM
jgi:predicted ATPase